MKDAGPRRLSRDGGGFFVGRFGGMTISSLARGGQLHYDLLLPVSRVALEFQGPQHYRTTERYPSASQLQEQRMRDEVKRRFSDSHGIALIEVTAADLSFRTISALLRRHGVPLRTNLDDLHHLYSAIEAEAAKYRRWAERLERQLRQSRAGG
ncbi:MAG: hypothetical protein CWE10_21135 [Symbiobacterium thermophilum]|uniref:Uncharacterized protein n=1 Tax=Symbiobacterium thermophilum TaxID=2734 RepID=A0A953ICQ2_SYMTR|nr:hypothetical protein [Symbiobacterium thermophilum]